MHALVCAVLLRLAWVNALMRDAQAHPPDVQVREAMNGLRGERHAIVGADSPRQSELPERALEDGLRRERLG